MLRGNWGKYVTTGLIAVGIIVAVASAALIVAWGRNQSAEYEREAYDQAREYAAYTNQQIRQTCLGLSPDEKQRCIDKARNEQRADDRAEQDLVAQRQSALWAYIMGASAAIGMMLSVVGVVLVWITFKETRRGTDTAEKALRIETRPFVYLDSVDWAEREEPEGGMSFEFTFNIKNLGKLPATNLRLWTSVIAVPARDSSRHIFKGSPIVITACPQGVTRKTFDGISLSAEEAAYFHGMKLGLALGLRMIFDTRFLKDRCVEEYRWADARGRQRDKLIFMDRPQAIDVPDLFENQNGGEANHNTPRKPG